MEGAGSRDGIVLSITTEHEVSASTFRVTSTIQSWSQTGNKCRGGNHRPQMISHPATDSVDMHTGAHDHTRSWCEPESRQRIKLLD